MCLVLHFFLLRAHPSLRCQASASLALDPIWSTVQGLRNTSLGRTLLMRACSKRQFIWQERIHMEVSGCRVTRVPTSGQAQGLLYKCLIAALGGSARQTVRSGAK